VRVVSKRKYSKIIHSLSHRKHGKYIAVNCGAIPEGTIDSELLKKALLQERQEPVKVILK
jgi:transcriptional regulator of acetoin/glycerol metabolism